ncbi:type II restriction endonuclease [Ileibacterium valens]|uniref:type II restriction endonuclease n=1 Tax=Ileibacterium valens TaxID=1862668 RepID=UPI0035133DDE
MKNKTETTNQTTTSQFKTDSPIQSVAACDTAFCKFLSANDTGETGSHQSGFLIPKNAVSMFFDTPGEKGSNKDTWIHINWPDGITRKSRAIYYGVGTRNEYRLTNFGREFPYLKPDHTGSLLILTKTGDAYEGFVLDTEEEINEFLDFVGISIVQTNRLIPKDNISLETRERSSILAFIDSLDIEFPDAMLMAANARAISKSVHGLSTEKIISNPDKAVLIWTDTEFKIFRALENSRYIERVQKGFDTLDEFFSFAKSAQNRRFSRAGKSLERHLAALFREAGLQFEEQVVTEGNKKPDFIFPSGDAYRDSNFPVEKLTFLAVKTTCKDRWRQILNECNRLKDEPKYLFTLQQGISSNQLKEMEAENVILVVPKEYITYYPKLFQEKIWSLEKFINHVRAKEELIVDNTF